ncbi:Transposon Tf2-9 poly [Paramuricea clavata]|uniref:Transposon Tf2-9 poly n=1 Tax=Paramuricea clavata TaxID=317549 RepID=A0A6S7G6T3_PARCT|nr:Transposon Tf2-9 poly [Paramuricea clavata]
MGIILKDTWLLNLGIEWKTSSPLCPQSKGSAESVMKALGKVIKTSMLERKNWRQELQRFLLNYRSTPHATTKIPPCELLFNRKVQENRPELSTQNVVNKHRKANENIDKKKISNKQYYDAKKNTKTSKIKEGDIVVCKQKPNNKLSPRFNPDRGEERRNSYGTKWQPHHHA